MADLDLIPEICRPECFLKCTRSPLSNSGSSRLLCRVTASPARRGSPVVSLVLLASPRPQSGGLNPAILTFDKHFASLINCFRFVVGELSSVEIDNLMTIVANPRQFKIPDWFLNRKKDYKDGRYSQVVSNALDMKPRDDLERLKKIRYTVGKITPIQKREVRASDFGPQASFWMNFPKEGSQLTPPHKSEDFKWKDYCPMVFRNLREMFKINSADYMMSICGNDALRELSSPGKSGSVFFLSQDDRFMIKTLRKSEVKVLLRMLPDYYSHVSNYENTLITKFFGLHRIKPSSEHVYIICNFYCQEI